MTHATRATQAGRHLVGTVNLLRRHGGIACVLIILAPLYLHFSASEYLGQLDGDNAIYFLTARHFSAAVPGDEVARTVAAQSQFPPLYPAALAMLTGAVSIPAAHAATAGFLLLAFVAAYVWLLQLGLSRGMATVATALFAAMPGTWVPALSLQSEGLYLALSLLALVLLGRAHARPAFATLLGAALATGAAILCRTAGVALLVPLTVIILHARRPRWLLLPALSVAPMIAWSGVHQPSHSYLADVVAYYATSSLPLAQEASTSLAALGWGLAGNFLQTANVLWLAIALGAIAVLAALPRLRRGAPDAWYLLAYTVLILAWPYPSQARRFAWVMVPLLLGYVFWVAAALGRRWPGRGRALPQFLVAGTVLLGIAPSLAVGIERWNHPLADQRPALRRLPDWYAADFGEARLQSELQIELLTAIEELGARVPPGECLWSIDQATVSLYSGRLNFEVPGEAVDDAEFHRRVDRGRCRHVLLLGIATPLFPTPLYPAARLGERLEFLARREVAVGGQRHLLAALARLKT